MELNKTERKLIDYALCFLAANLDETNLDDLDMSEERIHDIILDIKKEI